MEYKSHYEREQIDMENKKLCNVQNIGVYLSVENPVRKVLIKERIQVQIDGFATYYEGVPETEKIVLRDLFTLSIPKGTIVVPDNAYYFPDGTFYSLEAGIALRMAEWGMDMWVGEDTSYLPYAVQFLLEKRSQTFVHGAGVAVDGTDGYLLLAFGGIGKTCFVANALKKDRVTLLGDDLVILGENGELFSYPRPFCLYPYHRVLFPQFFEGKKFHFEEMRPDRYVLRISKKLKQKLGIKDKVIYDYLPVSPIHLFKKEKMQVAPVRLKKAFVLRRVTGLESIRVLPAEDLDRVANFAHDVIQFEWSVGIRLEYNYLAHREESHCDAASRQYGTIRKCLDYAESVVYVDIPEKMDAESVSEELNALILKGIE